MKNLISIVASCGFALLLLTLGMSREIPVGSVSGIVTMAENGRPLSGVLVIVSPATTDSDSEFQTRNYHVRTASDGHFALAHLPSGEYRVEVVAKEHNLKARTLEVEEGDQTKLSLDLEPKDPSLQVYVSQKVIAPQTAAKVEIVGFSPESKFNVQIRRLKLHQIAHSQGVTEALEPVSFHHNEVDPSDLHRISEEVWSNSITIQKKDAEGSFIENAEIPKLDEGLYFVNVQGHTLNASAFLNVTRIALVTKTAGANALCFVTDIDSGQPIPNVSLGVNLGKNSQIAPLTRTDQSGLATISLKPGQSGSLVVAQFGKSIAVANSNLNSSNDSGEHNNPNIRIFTYSDRPVYRPGDTVQFKAVIRKLAGDNLILPGAGNAQIKILDDQENELQEFSLPISNHGTLHGSFATSVEAKPGVYQIQVNAFGGQDSYYANLAAYRKPDYSVKVTATKPRFVMGDTASAVVECQYFFGGPVVGAQVTATVYRSPDWGTDEDDGEGDDDEAFQGGEVFQTVTATTDGLGKALIKFPTLPEHSTKRTADDLSNYRYSVQASVEGSGNRSFEGSTSVLVTQGAFDLSLTTDPGFLSLKEQGNVVVKAASFDSPARPIPGQSVRLQIDEETFTAHTIVYQPVQTVTVTTDSTGSVRFPITPTHACDLRVRGTALDREGRPIGAETDLYVDGSPREESIEEPKLELQLNRKSYSVGDVAKVLVSTTNPGGVALLTVESDTIKTHLLVPLPKGSAVIKLPVGVSMSPNAFVSAAYVCHRKYTEANKKLVVSRKEKALTVIVTPDRPKALPGSEVTFHIKTASANGNGVPANVSLGLVDESIYTIKKDNTDIKSSVYPQKDDLVQTNFSFPEIYLDGGDKAGGSVPVRRKFLDTAKWIPEIETDAKGEAFVKVTLPDNLTSWRATSVAATDDSAVGMSTASLIASKPLMVRVLTPRFLVATDRQTVSAAVTNDSGESLQVKFAASTSGITLNGPSASSLDLAAGQTENVSLPISAPSSGDAAIRATVTCDKGFSDAMEAKLRVLPHARLVETTQSAVVNMSKTFDFDLAETRDSQVGGLEVTVTPSIASGLIQSLDQLVQFPYGCVEQTLSRFLPALAVVDTIKGTPLASPKLTLRSKKISVDGFARLEKMQHEDGGWGWWTYDESDPFLTAWVLDGLRLAERCGAPPPATLSPTKALEWGAKRLRTPHKNDPLDSKLFLLMALAEYGNAPEGSAFLRQLDLQKCDAGELALASLAADAIHDGTFRDGCLDRIASQIKRDAWDFGKDHWWNRDEQVALVLRAFTSLRPNDSLIPMVAVRLETMKRSDGWFSTRATTLATVAMCDYIRTHPSTLSKGVVSVALNGTLLRTIEISPVSPDPNHLKFNIPTSKLRPGINRLTVSGNQVEPYVAANLKQYDVEPVLGARPGEESFTVSRSYYRMEPTRVDDGTLKLLPSRQPISEFKSGEIIRCKVVVHCNQPVDFLQLEDPLPSNCEVTDREDPMDGSSWTFWWSDLTILDDRVALFARNMPKGDNVLTYTMRAEGDGASSALPTSAQDMYSPQFFASGAESKLKVIQ